MTLRAAYFNTVSFKGHFLNLMNIVNMTMTFFREMGHFLQFKNNRANNSV